MRRAIAIIVLLYLPNDSYEAGSGVKPVIALAVLVFRPESCWLNRR